MQSLSFNKLIQGPRSCGRRSLRKSIAIEFGSVNFGGRYLPIDDEFQCEIFGQLALSSLLSIKPSHA